MHLNRHPFTGERRRPACILAAVVISCIPAMASAAPAFEEAGTRRSVIPALTWSAPQQSPQAAPAKGTGVIRGRVVRSDTGDPVPRARVVVRSAGHEARDVLTDDEGRFQIEGLIAGSLSISVSKDGFVALSFGQRRPGQFPRPVQMRDGQVVEDIDFALPPSAAIEGLVLDEFGDPLAGASVQAHRRRSSTGEPRFVADGVPSFTDDRGRFRVYGLTGGEYYLAVTPPDPTTSPQSSRVRLQNASRAGTAPTWYPGTATPSQAQPLTLSPGQDFGGIVIQAMLLELASITGTVTGGQATTRSLLLVQNTLIGGSSDRRSGNLRSDGTFAFPDLAPGDYMVVARGADDELALARVSLQGQDVTVALQLARLPRLRGRVVFEGDAPAQGAGRVRVVSVEVNNLFLPAGSQDAVRDDLTFDVPGAPGAGHVAVAPPAGWYMRSVFHRGLDVTDGTVDFTSGDVDGIEVVLTQRVTTLTGTVAGGHLADRAGAVIVAFADDPARWMAAGPARGAIPTRYFRSARGDQEGRFEIKGLPQGRYRVAALMAVDPEEDFGAALFERLRDRATPVTLDDGESRTLTLEPIDE